MPTLPVPGPPQSDSPAKARQIAESFGADPEQYHRARPRYPNGLLDELAKHGKPPCSALDIGIGSGLLAEQLRARGYDVTGVEPDPRMAAYARGLGFAVDVSTFEAWASAERRFDLLTAGMTWHWVDPETGATKAAHALRPGGTFAAFWNVHSLDPPLAQAMAQIYAEITPGSPLARAPKDPVADYGRFLDTTASQLAATGAFEPASRHRYDWTLTYQPDQWIDLVLTFGGHSLLDPNQRATLTSRMQTTIHNHTGTGTVPVRYSTLVVLAHRVRTQRKSVIPPPLSAKESRPGVTACLDLVRIDRECGFSATESSHHRRPPCSAPPS
jgi:SAM-dependent methyltransferase